MQRIDGERKEELRKEGVKGVMIHLSHGKILTIPFHTARDKSIYSLMAIP